MFLELLTVSNLMLIQMNCFNFIRHQLVLKNEKGGLQRKRYRNEYDNVTQKWAFSAWP